MAYNPYNNPYLYGYGAVPSYQPTYQPQQQQVQQQVKPQQQINEVRFVTEDERKGYTVYPNTTSLLIDKKNGIAELKSANLMGESVSQVFKFSPLEDNKQPELDPVVYVKQDDIKGFVKEDAFNTALNGIRNDLKALTEQVDKLDKKIKLSEI